MKFLIKIVFLLMVCSSLSTHAEQSFAQTSAITKITADNYFNAYVSLNWDVLEPLFADEGVFIDPTAKPIFGEVKMAGKSHAMKNFREGYASITHMQFNKTRSFYSGSYAVFEGTLDWTYTLSSGESAVTKAMPFLTILHIDAGKIIEHRDYADYHPFLNAYQQAKSQK